MYIYIFLSFLFTFFFFLTFFILPSSFLPLSSRDLFFLTRAFSQESSSSLFHFLSLPLSGIRFNPSIRFPNRSFFFSPFFSLSGIFFSLSVSRGLFSLYLPELDFSGFLLDRFYVPNDFSDSSFKIVLPSLSVRIQGISLSIFPVDSSRNRLDFRPLPSPKLSRIPPLATLSLSFVPPLGIFTSSFESLRAL